MCKELELHDLEAIVNKYKLNKMYWEDVAAGATFDTALDQHLTGELYQELLKMRLWYQEYQEKFDGIKDTKDFWYLLTDELDDFDDDDFIIRPS